MAHHKPASPGVILGHGMVYVARTRTRTRTRYEHGHEDTAIFEK